MRGPPGTAAIERAIGAIATGAIAIASALMGATAVAAILDVLGSDQSPGIRPSVGALVSTAVLAAHVAWHAVRSDRPVAAALGRALVAGIMNVPLAIALVAMTAVDELIDMGSMAFLLVPAGLVIATILAAPLGGALGLLFGLGFAPLVAAARDDLGYRDLGAPARTAIASGIWLLAIAALAALAAAGGAEWATSAALVCGALGAVLALGGTVARVRRRRRLARVVRGEVPGWAIVLREAVRVDEELPLYDRGVLGDRVLVRVAATGEGAYRTADAHVAIAAVPDHPGPDRSGPDGSTADSTPERKAG